MCIKRKYKLKSLSAKSFSVDADTLAERLALEVVPVVRSAVEVELDALLAVEVVPQVQHATLTTLQGSGAVCSSVNSLFTSAKPV